MPIASAQTSALQFMSKFHKDSSGKKLTVESARDSMETGMKVLLELQDRLKVVRALAPKDKNGKKGKSIMDYDDEEDASDEDDDEDEEEESEEEDESEDDSE